jgi:hypothetical protein
MHLSDVIGDNLSNIGVDGSAGDVVGLQDSSDVASGIRGRDLARSADDKPDAVKSLVSLASLDALLSELGINLSESLALGKSFLNSASLGSAFCGLDSSQVR